MEHNLRHVGAEHGIELVLIAHITYDRHEIELREAVGQFQSKVVQRRLSIVQEHQTLHSYERQLATKLRTDASCGTCHQHHTVGELRCDGLHIDFYLGPTEQVFDAYLAWNGHLGLVSHATQLLYRRREEHFHVGLSAVFHQSGILFIDILHAREYHSLNLVTIHHTQECGLALKAIHQLVGYPVAALHRAWHQKAYHIIAGRKSLQLHEAHAVLLGTIHQDVGTETLALGGLPHDVVAHHHSYALDEQQSHADEHVKQQESHQMGEGETLVKVHDGKRRTHEDVLYQYRPNEDAYLVESAVAHGETACAQSGIGHHAEDDRTAQEEQDICRGIRYLGDNGEEAHRTDGRKECAEQVRYEEKVEIDLLVDMCFL